MIINDFSQFEDHLKTVEWAFIEFSSPGCSPCKKQLELLKEIEIEYSNLKITIFEIDITKYPKIAEKFKVLSVPTLLLLFNGVEKKRFFSLQKKDSIIQFLNY